MKQVTGIVMVGLLALMGPLEADGPRGGGRGHGKGGPGGGKGGGGPLPAEQRETIHDLFTSHEAITREVKLTDDGYTARTTSNDPKVAAKIQEHVAAMEKRLDGGFPVRRWDPAFEEFFQHYKDLKTTITRIEKGVAVTVKGTTPEAVKVARNHARIISGFVEKGDEQHHAKHPVALGEAAGKEVEPGKGGCQECGKQCQCGAAGKDKKDQADKNRQPER